MKFTELESHLLEDLHCFRQRHSYSKLASADNGAQANVAQLNGQLGYVDTKACQIIARHNLF